jgi:formamidopyrimidine-DNA glycosylase
MAKTAPDRRPMPELPEVETVRRGIERVLPGRTLRKVTIERDDLRWPIPVRACRGLQRRTCTLTSRRSKYLGLHFDGPGAPVALIHLGMSGRLWLEPADSPGLARWRDHEHWRMDFGDTVLRYVDARRFGMLDVVASAELATHKLIRDLGPEPLGPAFHGAYLFDRSRRRRVATKAFLMDARNVVGVGNIYASEACFCAGVRPRRRVLRLTRAECAALAHATRSVLLRAIAAGGTTIRDYVGVDEDKGYFQRELMVYGRWGEPCRQCGSPIKRTIDGGRSTYYCPTCQT